MRAQPPPLPLTLSRTTRVYIAAVILAGFVALVLSLMLGDLSAAADRAGLFWLLVALVLVGELLPITIPRHDDVEEFTTSTTFAFALVLAVGTAPAVVALSLASLLADLARRKVWWKALFNLGQYAVSIGAAGAVYHGLGGTAALEASDLWPMVAGAGAFFVLNYLLPGIGIALASEAPVLEDLRHDMPFHAGAAAPLLALAPVMVILSERSLAWGATLVLPLAAVYVGARIAVENSRLVARLGEALGRQTELNRMKDEFVAVVSHELRTPLTSIKGTIRTMLRYGRSMTEEDRRPLAEAADRQAERLEGLIEQLLLVARLDSQAEPLRLAPVSLPTVLRNVVSELSVNARGHVIDLRVEDHLPEVHTDEMKLHQILSNLVDNALKYSPPLSRVTILARPAGESVEIEVHDQGQGIAQREQERIFERFYQVDQSSTRTVGGLGLGLYISRRMADAIGAKVELTRSGEEGSVFAVRIPLIPPKAMPAEDGSRRDGVPEASRSSHPA